VAWVGSGGGLGRDDETVRGVLEKTAEARRNCGLLAYHYSEIGTDDLKQIVQSAARHNIGTAIALLFERYISGRK
jgi:hypothetical protein